MIVWSSKDKITTKFFSWIHGKVALHMYCSVEMMNSVRGREQSCNFSPAQKITDFVSKLLIFISIITDLYSGRMAFLVKSLGMVLSKLMTCYNKLTTLCFNIKQTIKCLFILCVCFVNRHWGHWRSSTSQEQVLWSYSDDRGSPCPTRRQCPWLV